MPAPIEQSPHRARPRVGSKNHARRLDQVSQASGVVSSRRNCSLHHHQEQITSENLNRHYDSNQQYSITALTDGGGTIVERYAYTAYGQVSFHDASGTVQTASASNSRYTYTGREWDEGLSLCHYRARMYDAVSGRFLSRDPIGFRGSKWNFYKFLGCKPLRYLDPLGLQDITFPPILIDPPNIDPPAPPIDWPENPTGTGLLTGACQQIKDRLRASMHPVIAKILEDQLSPSESRGDDGP